MASSRQVGQVKHNAPKLLVDVLSCTALREFSNRKKRFKTSPFVGKGLHNHPFKLRVIKKIKSLLVFQFILLQFVFRKKLNSSLPDSLVYLLNI